MSGVRLGRAFLLLGAILVLSASKCPSGGQPSPQIYNCGTVSSGHCYSEALLGDHLAGFRTTFTVVQQFLPGDGFVTNEFWLTNYQGNDGWIELGYQVNSIELKYFWAVLDPDTGIFTKHDIGPIPPEEVATRVVFDIHQTAEDTFVISIDGSKTHFATTAHVNLWDGSYGGHVKMGQELAGSKGAAASLAMFVENQVYDSSSRRRFATAGDGPSEKVDKPPYGGWMQQPAVGNQGGVFSTYCCVP